MIQNLRVKQRLPFIPLLRQKKGGICAIIDAEHAFDTGYARKLGVDVDNLII